MFKHVLIKVSFIFVTDSFASQVHCMSLAFYLTISLCSPSWPGTPQSACLCCCFLNAGMGWVPSRAHCCISLSLRLAHCQSVVAVFSFRLISGTHSWPSMFHISENAGNVQNLFSHHHCERGLQHAVNGGWECSQHPAACRMALQG